MNCSEFEDLLQDEFDADPSAATGAASMVESHLAVCESCRAAQARYQVLRQAMGAWGSPPPASADSLRKLHALTMPATERAEPEPAGKPKVRRPGRFLQFAIPLATAAAVAAIWVVDPAAKIRERPIDGQSLAQPAPTNISARRFQAAVADATRVTLDLAREASAPAGRIGREAMELEEVTLRIEVPPGLAAAGDSAGAATGLIKTLGDRVGSGVKPLSGSARHAFSFLLGPETPTPSKGGGGL